MSSDIGNWPEWLCAVLLLALILINSIVASSKRALDYIDRTNIKDHLEDDPGNIRLQHTMDFVNKPSKYHYADMTMSYILLILSWFLLNLKGSSMFRLRGLIIANIVFFLIWLAFADILPKKLAAQNSDETAVSLVNFQRFIYYLTFPAAKFATLVANLFLVMMNKQTDVDDMYFSEEKVMSMIDQGTESGNIKEEAHKMIDSIFEFDDLLAYEIMTPRTDVFMIDVNDDRKEYFDQLMELRYSRIPVYEGDPDNIIGILHIKDYLLKASVDGFDSVDIKSILREPYMVPETKKINTLFVELQHEKQHVAVLIDEYGGFSGIVTIEDLIEQIVGDIDDEFDEEERVIKQVDDNVYIVDGNVYLDDLDDETGIQLESENSETVGGYIIDLMGEIPKEDKQYKPFRNGKYIFEILGVKDRRIDRVRIEIADDGTENNSEEDHKA